VDARDAGQAATLMAALAITSLTHIQCGNYGLAKEQLDEVCTLADEKSAMFWRVGAMLLLGCVSALRGKAADGVQTIGSELQAWRSTGASLWMPVYLAHLISAYTDLGRFDEAWRCFEEAATLMQKTKEKWCEAEIYRIAAELAIRSPDSDVSKAEAFFGHALEAAKAQQANLTSCAPRPVSRACGGTRGGAMRRATCLRRSTIGTPRASIPSI
jgi:pentatricopeptide repeat protein